MENEEQLPEDKKLAQTDGDELPPIVDPNPDGTCPTGYFYDKETDKCILDVG